LIRDKLEIWKEVHTIEKILWNIENFGIQI